MRLTKAIQAARRRRLGADYVELIPFPPESYAGCRTGADRIVRSRGLLMKRGVLRFGLGASHRIVSDTMNHNAPLFAARAPGAFLAPDPILGAHIGFLRVARHTPEAIDITAPLAAGPGEETAQLT
jgi:hypothetical protein